MNYNGLAFVVFSLFIKTFLVAQINENLLNYQQQIYQINELNINTHYSDYGVDFFDDQVVIFSSPSKKMVESLGKNSYIHLYQGKLTEEGSITDTRKFAMELDSDFHEAKFVFTKNGKYAYFTTGDQNKGKGVRVEKHIQLYGADVVNGTLKNITLLDINETVCSTAQPFLADDDKTLYFSSNRFGGNGGMDLYKVAVLGKNSFGQIINLGDKINTQGDEIYPFVDVDDVLYFSSDREGTKGGLDVYAVSLRDTLKDVYQLPFPINSEKDDFGFILSTSNHGFLSSNRDGGLGEDDIYGVTTLNNFQKIKGVVYNKQIKTPMENTTIEIYKGNILVDTITTNSKGSFNFLNVVAGEKYKIKAFKRDFWVDSVSVTIPATRYHVTNVVFNLEENFKKNELGSVIMNIDPIYFNSGKYNIIKNAQLGLDKVVFLMNKYPEIKIEVSSHTDSKGNSENNQKLSEKRAKASVDYILSKGISLTRITYKGYGESMPINKCADGVNCNDEEHKQNRRTEFMILE